MTTLHLWPSVPPEGLAGLGDQVATLLGGEARPFGDPAAGDRVLAVVDGTADTLGMLADLAGHDGVTIALVVADSFLGTEDRRLGTALAAASAVALARSIAVRRTGGTRANVVAVPATFFGDTGDHRGPLAGTVTVSDVAAAAAFFLSEEAGYLNGQVLFVDAGRHLFASMSA